MKNINLENVQEATEFNRLKAGGYVCGIFKVEDVSDREYLKIYYDIIEGENKGYYTKLVKDKVFKNLPFFFASYKETALRFFKATITSVEKSNKGYKFDYNEQSLVKKKIGLVLFEEEYEDKVTGAVKTSLKVDKAHSIEAIKSGDFEVPDTKYLTQSVSPKANVADNPFGQVEEDTMVDTPEPDEEFPF